MNCTKCGRVIYANSRKCQCGWKVPVSSTAPVSTGFCEHTGCSSPGTIGHSPYSEGGWLCSYHFFGEQKKNNNTAFLKISGQKRREIDAFVQSHKSMSKRDACLMYLREKQLLGALPESLKEALDERVAIQAEGQ